MRLELTCVCSLNGFQLVMDLNGGHSSLYLKVFFPSPARQSQFLTNSQRLETDSNQALLTVILTLR